jgi:hypothetical protein
MDINRDIIEWAAPSTTRNGKVREHGYLNTDTPHRLDGLSLGKGTMSDQPENESPVAIAARKVIALVDAVETDPKEMVRSSIRRVAARQYPTPA